MPLDTNAETVSLLSCAPHFTVEEKEWLCQLDYTPSEKNPSEDRLKAASLANERKKAIARDLATVFEYGSKDAAPDHWKAHDLRVKAGIPSTPPKSWLESDFFKRHFSWLTDFFDRHLPWFFRTDTFYRWHAWFLTGIRLFLVRVHRLTNALGKGFLPSFFAFFGLSYGIGFALDLFIVIKATFFVKQSPQEIEANEGFWKRTWTRFKNIILKDNRPYRMLNDFVWFTVNLVVLCTAGPLYLLLNPILNLAGFGFDTCHELFWLGRDAQKHMTLVNKFTTQIEAKEDQLKNNNSEELKNDINHLKLMREKVISRRNEVIRRRLWISCWTAVVMVGMVLVYFPPTTLPGAFLIGSGLALIGGSVFTGIGRRLYLYGESYYDKIVKWFKEKTKDELKPDNSLKNSTYVSIELRVVAEKTNVVSQPDELRDEKTSLVSPPAMHRIRSRSLLSLPDNTVVVAATTDPHQRTHKRTASLSCAMFSGEASKRQDTSGSRKHTPIEPLFQS